MICLFIVEWWDFFLAIFETLGRNSLPEKSFSLPSILPWGCRMSSTVQGQWCSIINSTLPPWTSPPPLQSPSTAHKHLSCHHQNLPVTLVNFLPELRKHRTGVLDHHHRVSKAHAEQGTISCFVHLDCHPHRHNCLSLWSYCIIPPTQNVLCVQKSRVPYSHHHTFAPFWRFF